MPPVFHPIRGGVPWFSLRLCADGEMDDPCSWSGLRGRSRVAGIPEDGLGQELVAHATVEGPADPAFLNGFVKGDRLAR